MAYFARKLRYGACDGDGSAFYFALVELTRKKGGRAVGFVLYRRAANFLGGLVKNRAEMITLGAETTEEAIRRFWPSDEKGMGSEFPGHGSKRWKRTTLWLDSVAAGGAYECFGYENHYERGIRLGRWAKVGTPILRAERRKRHKKTPLQVGNLAHILLKHRAQLLELSRERRRAQLELDTITSYHDDDGDICIAEADAEEHVVLLGVIAETDERIAFVHADIDRTKEEMRYIVRKMFPKSTGLIPKRVLRYERERKDMGLF